jgi:hypothetical protein
MGMDRIKTSELGGWDTQIHRQQDDLISLLTKIMGDTQRDRRGLHRQMDRHRRIHRWQGDHINVILYF